MIYALKYLFAIKYLLTAFVSQRYSNNWRQKTDAQMLLIMYFVCKHFWLSFIFRNWRCEFQIAIIYCLQVIGILCVIYATYEMHKAGEFYDNSARIPIDPEIPPLREGNKSTAAVPKTVDRKCKWR